MASRKASALDFPPGGNAPSDGLYLFRGGLPYQETVGELSVAQVLTYALSDEDTELVAGTKLTIRMPFECTLLAVRSSVKNESTAGNVIVDINESLSSGGASVLSTKLSIDQDERTSVTAAAPAIISAPDLDDDAEITFDLDDAGVGASGLKVYMYVKPTGPIVPTIS